MPAYSRTLGAVTSRNASSRAGRGPAGPAGGSATSRAGRIAWSGPTPRAALDDTASAASSIVAQADSMSVPSTSTENPSPAYRIGSGINE